MTPTNNELSPSDPQIGKLYERLLAAARKSGVTRAMFQDAMRYPGTELEQRLINVFQDFALASMWLSLGTGLCTPVRAEETGLVPDNWTTDWDEPEGEIDLSNLNFRTPITFSKINHGEWIHGTDAMKRAKGLDIVGSLGLGKVILDAQNKGTTIIPSSVKNVLFARTILNTGGQQSMFSLRQVNGVFIPRYSALHRCYFREGDKFIGINK
jgi:hypothetical protein